MNQHWLITLLGLFVTTWSTVAAEPKACKKVNRFVYEYQEAWNLQELLMKRGCKEIVIIPRVDANGVELDYRVTSL